MPMHPKPRRQRSPTWAAIICWTLPGTYAGSGPGTAHSQTGRSSESPAAQWGGSHFSAPRARASSLAMPAQDSGTPLASIGERLLEDVQVLESEAGAKRDAVQRSLGDVAGDAGYVGEQSVEVTKERG